MEHEAGIGGPYSPLERRRRIDNSGLIGKDPVARILRDAEEPARPGDEETARPS